MSPKSTLCNHCRLIFSRQSFNVEEDDDYVVKDYLRSDTLPELPSLMAKAGEGCSFCTELKERISVLEWPSHVGDIIIGPATLIHESKWESELTPEQEGIVMVEVTISALGRINFALNFEVFASPDSYPSTEMRVRRKPPSINRRSSSCIERLQQMISKCADNHWQCDVGDEAFWPTRVIDVGSLEYATNPKLVVTSGRAARYLALSHCWGTPGAGVRMLKTLSSTIESHMLGIPLDRYCNSPFET
jgi:hypothetical protein